MINHNVIVPCLLDTYTACKVWTRPNVGGILPVRLLLSKSLTAARRQSLASYYVMATTFHFSNAINGSHVCGVWGSGVSNLTLVSDDKEVISNWPFVANFYVMKKGKH